MYFENIIRELSQNNDLKIFVDMDGVITDYNFNEPLIFKNKRPLMTNIKTLDSISKIPNVELFILSICIKDSDIEEKNNWLDKYASYFKKENRIIISKESYPNISSKDLKLNKLKELKENIINKKVMLIDDDNEILKYIRNNIKDIILIQDSSLID